MITIFRHEMKISIKSLLIWFVCVGGMGFACVLMFSSMKDSMQGMAENFASMGAFSDAFGMKQLSIATLTGFYATEIGTIHSLGGAMFAAILCTSMLSKEEDGHTSEFLFTLPLSRGKVIAAKWAAVVSNIFLFNLLCVALYYVGFLLLNETVPAKEFFLFHLMQFLMQLEIAAICYAISAFMRKNKIGLGLGVVLFLYAYDLIARVIPDLSDYKFISPFSYANAADVFSAGEICIGSMTIGVIVLAVCVIVAYMRYRTRDLAS